LNEVEKKIIMNRIGQILKEKGLKQNWLASQLGMTTVMISLYVQNKRQPKLETLIRISQILKSDINLLIDPSVPKSILP
jgi:transcriptional regulator with XRE-family HTH domain